MAAPTLESKMKALTQIRLLVSEKEGFEEAANLAGLSLSAWMRERLRSIARKELEAHGRVAAFLKK
jgi:hypothetical protein